MITLTVVKKNTAILPTPQEGKYDLKDRAYWIETSVLPDGTTPATKVMFLETSLHQPTELLVEETFSALLALLPTFADLEIVKINSAKLPTPRTLGVNIAKMAKQLPTTFEGSAATTIYLYHADEDSEGKQLVTLDTIPSAVLDLC